MAEKIEIVLAEPRGFCAGVDRAVRMAEEILNRSEPLYLLHEIVHNENVTNEMKRRGAVLVKSLAEIPAGAKFMISAHGDGRAVFDEAQQRGLTVVDATCPLVRKVQMQAKTLAENGKHVLLFGDRSHREIRGLLGQCPPNSVTVLEDEAAAEQFNPAPGTAYACLSQTTWNGKTVKNMTEILRRKIPGLLSAGSVCNATQARQESVKKLAEACDAVLVVGSSASSNTMRLLEIARQYGKAAFLVQDETCLTKEITANARRIGITSGASAPEKLVQAIARKLNGINPD